MKYEVMKQWTEALRSGKYKQGQGRLKDSHDYFCCLGVLCDLYDTTKWYNKSNLIYFGDNHVDLPRLVTDWAEMYSTSGYLSDRHTPLDGLSLATMNDSGKSFEEIADYIEQNWEHL
jgi:hypothetical protein